MGSFRNTGRQLLLLSSLFLVHSLSRNPAVTGLYYVLCGAKEYTTNSTFDSNLGYLLSSLSGSAPAIGFANSTSGDAPDQAFGLAQCRGDLTAAQCSLCLAAAVKETNRLCPNKRAAVLWNETCHLRYSDGDFFGKLRGEKLVTLITRTVTSDPNFVLHLLDLLDGLTKRAPESTSLYAAGKIDVNLFKYEIYGLVQCARDLSPVGCSRCFKTAIDDVIRYYEGYQGAWVIEGSCDIRYGVFPFFNVSGGHNG